MKTYLTNLLIEKGITSNIENDMLINGHIGMTYKMQIDFITNMPKEIQDKIRKTFIIIDFKNGDVLHYWNSITTAMLKSC